MILIAPLSAPSFSGRKAMLDKTLLRLVQMGNAPGYRAAITPVRNRNFDGLPLNMPTKPSMGKSFHWHTYALVNASMVQFSDFT
ncbi:MAG: hypothetical protein H7839_08520 [Magnetococcus sp. YQC-5]